MQTRTAKSSSNYRVAPNLVNASIFALISAVVLVGLQKSSGVPYTDVDDSAENLRDFALIPMAATAATATVFAFVSGWWRDLWKDEYKLSRPRWLNWVLVLFIAGILANFASGNIGDQTSEFLLTALAATALVGYTEEILFRGLVLRGSRGSGFSENKVMVVTAFAFGIFHAANLVNGAPLGGTLFQVVNAGLAGAGFYILFRKYGTILVPMVIHALVDFSLFTRGESAAEGSAKEAIGLISLAANVIIYVLVIVAYRKGVLNNKNEAAAEVEVTN